MVDRVIDEVRKAKNTSVRMLGIAQVETYAQKYFEIASNPDFKMAKANELQRENLEAAPQVYFYCSGLGLGDSIMQLRHAISAARARPEKNFIVQVPPSLEKIDYMRYPQNMRLTSKLDLKSIMTHDSFIIALYPPQNAIHTIVSPVDIRKQLVQMDKSFRIADFSRVINFRLSEVYKILGIVDHKSSVNLLDVVHAIQLRLLGIKVTKSDLEQPFLQFSKVDLDKHPQKWDILIAPDAREMSAKTDDRSRKSISAKKWAKIFSSLSRDQNIGIILGTEHPQYCQEVFAQAQKARLNVTLVKTPTLTDFCGEVLAAKKFVSMDSGTTHLASEVALAAKKAGRTIDIRELFNSASSTMSVKLSDYGIRGLGDQGKILNFQLNHYPFGVTDIQDIDNIDPQEAAEFILS